MSRKPARETYDAVVDLYPPKRPSQLAYVLCKYTYDVSSGRCRLMEPDPLLHDTRPPDVEHPLMPGSDFRFFKAATDVVVLASAYPPDGRAVHSMHVEVGIGERRFRIQVFGTRFLEARRDGGPRIGQPEPFTEMPLRWERAYGGADLRVPVDEPTTIEESILQTYDHPGAYPRNPFGKGYVVLPELMDGIELPNLEDPHHLLTEQNVIVRDPGMWYLQPRPVALNWVQPLMFPRYVYMGKDAWFPGPEDERMPEVALGFLERSYRQRHLEVERDFGPTIQFFQEANPFLVFHSLPPGTPISLSGMRPDGQTMAFAVPHPPEIELTLEGRSVMAPVRLLNVLIEPDRFQVSFSYSAQTTNDSRSFIAGVHGDIPLSARINDDAPILYETPEPLSRKGK